MKYERQREADGTVYYSANLINLCVDDFDEEIQRGKLYHLYTGEPVPFSSLLQAMKRMDALYDELRLPQASTELRSFLVDRREKKSMVRRIVREPEFRKEAFTEMERLGKMLEHRGAKATFFIRVVYRQYSSWQGEIIWVDRQKKEYFRSVLELIRLLDSALDPEKKEE